MSHIPAPLVEDSTLEEAIKMLVYSIAVAGVEESSVAVAKLQLEDGRIAVLKMALSVAEEDIKDYDYDCAMLTEPNHATYKSKH